MEREERGARPSIKKEHSMKPIIPNTKKCNHSQVIWYRSSASQIKREIEKGTSETQRSINKIVPK